MSRSRGMLGLVFTIPEIPSVSVPRVQDVSVVWYGSGVCIARLERKRRFDVLFEPLEIHR